MFSGDDVVVHNNRFAAMVAQGSSLGDRIYDANESALDDEQSAPSYDIPITYTGVIVGRLLEFQNVPFGVSVEKYDTSGCDSWQCLDKRP